VSPLFLFPQKTDDPFLNHHRLSFRQYRPIFSSKADDSGVTPSRVSPHTFFTCPTSSIHCSLYIQPQKFLFFRVSLPPGGCDPGLFPPPGDATGYSLGTSVHSALGTFATIVLHKPTYTILYHLGKKPDMSTSVFGNFSLCQFSPACAFRSKINFSVYGRLSVL